MKVLVEPLVSLLRRRLLEADYAVAIGPLSTFAQKIYALKTFEHGAVLFAAASGGFETVVLGHEIFS